MHALQVREWGDLLQVRPGTILLPAPAPGDYLVRMVYSGVNFMDVYTVRGAYRDSRTHPLSLPLTLGVEGCGTINAAGEGAESFQVGQRVSFCLQWGAHAEWASVPAAKLARVPDDVGSSIAAAVTFQGVTAHYLANDVVALRPGDWALVWSGAGGIARLLTGMLRRKGVQVIATASSAEKAAAARRSGAEVVLKVEEDDIDARVREIPAGGAAVVYDSSGQATIATSMRCVRRRGTLVLAGTNSGPVRTLDVAALMEAGSISFIRPRQADYVSTSAEFAARTAAVFGMVADGTLDAAPSGEFPLDQGMVPMRQLVQRTAIGKSVLRIGPG